MDCLPVYPLLTFACLVLLCNTLFSDFRVFVTTKKSPFYYKRAVIPVLLRCVKCYLMVSLIILYCVNFNTFVDYWLQSQTPPGAGVGNRKGGAAGSGTKGSGGDASQTCALLRKGQPVLVQKVELASLETFDLDVTNLRAT